MSFRLRPDSRQFVVVAAGAIRDESATLLAFGCQ
jgi:hypothetical protein